MGQADVPKFINHSKHIHHLQGVGVTNKPHPSWGKCPLPLPPTTSKRYHERNDYIVYCISKKGKVNVLSV